MQMQHSADSWDIRQIIGSVWRTSWWWGALSAVAVLTRTGLDWFVPPATFYTRSIVTTFTAIGLFAAAGVWTAWRTRSLRSGVVAGIAMGVISAALVLVGSLLLVAFRHDDQTLWAIERSGGIGEVFELPIIMALPGAIVAGIGAAIGKQAAALFRRPSS